MSEADGSPAGPGAEIPGAAAPVIADFDRDALHGQDDAAPQEPWQPAELRPVTEAARALAGRQSALDRDPDAGHSDQLPPWVIDGVPWQQKAPLTATTEAGDTDSAPPTRRGFLGRLFARRRREAVQESAEQVTSVSAEEAQAGPVDMHAPLEDLDPREHPAPEPAGTPGAGAGAALRVSASAPAEPEPSAELELPDEPRFPAELELSAPEFSAEPEREPQAAAGEPQLAADPAPAGAPKPQPAPAALSAPEDDATERVTEVLTSVLDRLGSAHHRPFSRA